MRFVRYGIPSLILVAGVVLILVGGDAGVGAGIVLVGVAGLVLLANAFLRLGLQSEGEREREEHAREFFTRHGRWPEQDDDAQS